ncbi:hypothetical protein NLI92_005062 [Priestia megaterium]|jgi:hypothetical protein|uniref:hypothetical protein n=1 Tax=Priestia megaterium TaxID=1404 RepID=UPI0021ACA1F3|nr:hypothetical protein [Priestia megaterium]MCR8929583.1 hypothetical protein [Priestia megaterium]
MGLDIEMYGKEDRYLDFKEIEESLHDALFHTNNNWRSYLYLRKIRDYYLTNVEFDRDEIDKFIMDLENIKIFIPGDYDPALSELIKILSSHEIQKISIVGD